MSKVTPVMRRHVRHRPEPVAIAHPECPVETERTTLYAATELYDTTEYSLSLDARAYAWSRRQHTPEAARSQALHDFAIDEALDSWIIGRNLVGVMGGHDSLRGSDDYRLAAQLGHALARGRVVATGGGPGAMEAANLGAWLAGSPVSTLENALTQLAAVPDFRPSLQAWSHLGLKVRSTIDRTPTVAVTSLGIPTWFYGYEPPNVFCDAIAKYFRNALREAILLQICNHGIVFLPGSAGTVQEIFQDACENYYAMPETTAPMILLGREYWTQTFPAWPLLQSLARGRAMESHIHLADSVEEVSAILAG